MKKILIGLLIAGILSVIPLTVAGDCHERCCDLYTWQKFYDVSHSVNGEWVTEEDVPAWSAREAAADFGLRAGYDCFVGFSHVEQEPILNTYRVSYSDNGWVTEYVEAETSEDAAAQLGLRAGFNCFVGNV